MGIFTSYDAIIYASIIILLSYIFNIISNKTFIPSVLMLVFVGFLIKAFFYFSHSEVPNLSFPLEILGIIGLIMIVLEAAIELELRKDKLGIIFKSLFVSLIILLASTFSIAYLIYGVFDCDYYKALVYAIPISTMSSAIIIPSIGGLIDKKKEFIIYESTFSDILGIMIFYFLIDKPESVLMSDALVGFFGNITLTIIIALVSSFVLVFIFHKIKSKAKLLLLISILFVLYSVGKQYHLSSLLIILFFGLLLRNHRLLQRKWLKKYYSESCINEILTDLTMITIEFSFVVRTFFFVIFGISISYSALIDLNVFLVSSVILVILYVIRYVSLRAIIGKDILPEVFVAPRGLVTILLFFNIPDNYRIMSFNKGVLLFVILISCIIMAISLVKHKKRETAKNILPLETEDKIDL